MSRLQALIRGATRSAQGVASLALSVGLIAVVVVLLAGRGHPAETTAGSDVTVAGAGSASGSASSTASAEPSIAAPTPNIAPSPEEASKAPSSSPMPDPTPAPTPDPTKRPATPRPTSDPAPEPTPHIAKTSGAFGQTLTLEGISVRLSPRESTTLALCGLTDDPEMQGFTEPVGYDLRITWSKPSEANEPWIGIGSTPFNVLWFDPQGAFKSGVDYVFETCHRPADSDRARVVISPDGTPMRQYEFTFR